MSTSGQPARSSSARVGRKSKQACAISRRPSRASRSSNTSRSVNTVGRWSDHSLYSEKHVTFEDDAGAYDQKDAAGFIKLNALRLKLIGNRNAKFK